MKVLVKCLELTTYLREFEVDNLHFNQKGKTFGMTYCFYDCWGLEMNWVTEVQPSSVDSTAAEINVCFELPGEADAFVEWLNEGEVRVQRGYETMRD